MIETRLLYYFLAVAREQNITSAANSLHISQPTLSKQMMDLEEQLGKQLFIRGKRKITLTEDGIFLRARAQEMIDLMNKTEAAFQNDQDYLGGDIYFGCGETHIMEYVMDVLKDIQKQYPEIKIHIYSGDAEAILERLDKGLLDMGLLLGPMEMDKYNYMHINKNDRFGLLMKKDCYLATKDFITLEDLNKIPLIFPLQTINGQQRLSWFDSAYENFNIVATYNLVYNATFMVEKGMGYAFCLDQLVDTSGNRNLTFRPIKPNISVNPYIVTKKYQTFSAPAKLFYQRLKLLQK